MTQPIRILSEDLADPICPHCQETLRSISLRRIESTLGVRYLYYCSACKKALGVSHRKGFWMG